MAPGAWGDAGEKLGTGLPSDFILTIRECTFGFPFADDESGEPGNVMFWAKGEQNIDGELSDGDIRLSIGEFEPGDKEGTFVIAADQNEKKRISGNSKYGHFFLSALGKDVKLTINDENVTFAGANPPVPLEARQEELGRAHLIEKDALMWVGAIVRINVVETSGIFRRGADKGKEWTGRQPIVTEFLGWAGDASSAAPTATATASAPQASGSSNGQFNADVEAAKAENFLAYVEKGTAAGLDPGDEKLTRKFFDSVRK